MKRLLITGASGFIGRQCLSPALSRGYDVHAVVSGRSDRPRPDVPGVTWHSVDLLAPGGVEDLVARVAPTHVLHGAWITTHGSYWTSPQNLAWLGVLPRMLPPFVEGGGQRFVSTGTCAEYAWAEAPLVEGRSAEIPDTFYGKIKLAHHDILAAAGQAMGFSAATGRVFFGYGAFEGPERLVPYACRQLIANAPAQFTSGTQVRDFMSVEDIGNGLVHLLDSDLTGACNIACGAPVTLGEILSILGDISGKPHLIELGARPDKPGEPKMIAAASERLRSTGWTPRVDLHAGLEAAYAWWTEHGAQT